MKKIIQLNTPIWIKDHYENQIEYYNFKYQIEQFQIQGHINSLPDYHEIKLDKKVVAAVEFFDHFKNHKSSLFLPRELIEKLHPEIQYAVEALWFHTFWKNYLEKNKFNCKKSSLNAFSPNQQVIKCKVNSKNILDINFIRNIQSFLTNNQKSKIRFDANCSLNLYELMHFLNSLNLLDYSQIEYFEEPGIDLETTIEFFKKTKIKIAYDEHFLNYYRQNKLMELPQIQNAFIILKPSLIGLKNSIDLINQLKNAEIPIIISSTYETFPNFLNLMYLSHYTNLVYNQDIYHGLDTILPLSNHFNAHLKIENEFLSLF